MVSGLVLITRGFNVVTVRYQHPLSLVPAAINQLRGSTIFPKLDLWSAYNVVCVCAGDEWKTAFSTTSGHYQYNVMAYGLIIAPAVFK